jgi:MoCo/4Fe-4S cofactor protein with predicted Tat translocation signal
MKAENEQLDLAAVREKLSGAHGKEYWRCLEELAGSEAFEQLLRADCPRQASAWADSVDRRGFLKLMGASLALAGLSGSPSAMRSIRSIASTRPTSFSRLTPIFYFTVPPRCATRATLATIAVPAAPRAE